MYNYQASTTGNTEHFLNRQFGLKIETYPHGGCSLRIFTSARKGGKLDIAPDQRRAEPALPA